MIPSEPFRGFSGQQQDGAGQIFGIGWRSDLVAYHRYLGALFSEPEHGFDEVVPEFRVEPRRAEDRRIASRGLECFFPFPFGTPVDAAGIRHIVFLQRTVARAGEYVVGGDVDHPDVVFNGNLGQNSRAEGVDPLGEFRFALRPVYCRIGRAIDDQVDTLFFYQAGDVRFVRNVHFGHIGEKILVLRIVGADLLQRAPQLPVCAGYQYFHFSRAVRCHRSIWHVPTPDEAGLFPRGSHRQSARANRCPERDRRRQCRLRFAERKNCRTCR